MKRADIPEIRGQTIQVDDRLLEMAGINEEMDMPRKGDYIYTGFLGGRGEFGVVQTASRGFVYFKSTSTPRSSNDTISTDSIQPASFKPKGKTLWLEAEPASKTAMEKQAKAQIEKNGGLK